MKSFLIITISIFFFINPVHAEIWICKSDRYDQVKFEITDAEIIQTYPNNDGRTYKITIDTRKAGIGLFGEMSNKERQYDFDIFMGSNSTAVIEVCLFGKISILLETKKFGDYFGMDDLISQKTILVKKPEHVYQSIVYRVNNEHSLRTIQIIRDKFFGENKDGVKWLMEQL